MTMAAVNMAVDQDHAAVHDFQFASLEVKDLVGLDAAVAVGHEPHQVAPPS